MRHDLGLLAVLNFEKLLFAQENVGGLAAAAAEISQLGGL
jgi:hypothetical protein